MRRPTEPSNNISAPAFAGKPAAIAIQIMPTSTPLTNRFERRIEPGLALFIIVSVAVIFVVDLQTPVGIADWMFFAIPLGATYFTTRSRTPYMVAAAATLLVVIDFMFSPEGDTPGWISILNRSFFTAMMWASAYALSQIISGRMNMEEQDWLRAGQSQLSERVIGELSLTQVSERILQFLAEYLEIRVGALYVLDTNGIAVRTSGFALPPDHQINISQGEGLLGQVLIQKQAVYLDPAPRDHLRVSSALGDSASTSIIVQPLLADGEVVGAVELGFVRHAFAADKTLLKLLAESLGVAIRTSKLRSEREALLRATQRQAEELQTQQEELRVTNEEIEQQSNVLRESQARLELQQAELEQTNVQLEEHTQMLAKQNDALEEARVELSTKAAELERSNQFKSEFLANMSHELRTPLNSSLILAKLLGDNPTGNLTDEQVKFARNIYSAGNDLLELINDILDLSKIEARKIEVTPETISVPQLMDNLVQTFRPMVDEKGLSFETTIEAGAPAIIQSDSQRLRQVMKNLLSNAIKFTSKGGIRLRIYIPVGGSSGDGIAFEVADTGIGIKPEQKEIIFEPFRQADGTTNRRFGGTGLGLSISRELASLLGGRIELQSTPGAGSTFTLFLPRALPERPSTQQPHTELRVHTQSMSPRKAARNAELRPQSRKQESRSTDASQNASRSGRLLLIIEDDVAFSTTLCDLASSLQYDCLIALTADEGIDMALRHFPTAIILDMHLPDHTGLTVLDRLKHNPATRHIPIQVISGFDYTQAALEMGAANVMLKPVDRDRLVDALSKLELKASHAERAVLIVEDNTIQRDSIRQLLKSESVRAVAVASASDALEQLRTSTFDCMVLDLALPDATGFELLEKMASDEAYSFPPVIVYTARAISQAEEQQLRRYSKSIIIKGARSPERLLDEVTLFLHKVEESLPAEQQRMLRMARSRDSVFEGRRILLVEDDVRNVFAITRILEPHGAKLEIARNGLEALAALKQHPDLELVLMDIMMPEMDGLQAMQEIRKDTSTAKLPIIALTAKAMPDDRQRCLDAGANDYITKPIDIEKLLSLLRIWLPVRRGTLA
jgi:signal transduction histidine kinase/CheY-like chemotaxis protein